MQQHISGFHFQSLLIDLRSTSMDRHGDISVPVPSNIIVAYMFELLWTFFGLGMKSKWIPEPIFELSSHCVSNEWIPLCKQILQRRIKKFLFSPSLANC